MNTLHGEELKAVDMIRTQIDFLLSKPQTQLIKRLLESMQKILTAIYYITE